MKTTNIVLIGVVGIGAVGAYMYMKNKKAQDNLLSGSLPTTTPTGTPSSGTPPLATTPLIPTPNLIEPVKISDSNLDNYNLQKAVAEYEPHRRNLEKFSSIPNSIPYKLMLKRAQPYIDRLASLGYKYDKGILVKI